VRSRRRHGWLCGGAVQRSPGTALFPNRAAVAQQPRRLAHGVQGSRVRHDRGRGAELFRIGGAASVDGNSDRREPRRRRGARRALVFGTLVASLPEPERLAFRRRVGYLPAGDGLLQNLSLRDNVALPLRFGSAGTPRDIEGRVNVMLTAVRLTAAAALRPAQAN